MSDASAVAELPVICGPTAAGKSAVAMWLAQQARLTIVSADSRQVYRGFDIGTGKPTPAERALVAHAGIDVADATERYSAAAWARDADQWIGTARSDGRQPVIVGGTGLYIRALFDGLFIEPPIDATRREQLRAYLDQMTTSQLQLWAMHLDPTRAALGRAQLARAIEIALLTGTRLSVLHRTAAQRDRWRARYLLVDPGAELPQRIAGRLDAMLSGGWVEEVEGLIERVPGDSPAWKAAGYRTIVALTAGEIAMQQAREAVLIETRQYAKRQRTWFRHQLPADRLTRVNPASPGWQDVVMAWWRDDPAAR